jgi:hypothetical protein
MLGCGNSSLSGDMYDDGFHSITSMDFSDLVISEMQQKNRCVHACMHVLLDVYLSGLPNPSIDHADCLLQQSTLVDCVVIARSRSVVKIHSDIEQVSSGM